MHKSNIIYTTELKYIFNKCISFYSSNLAIFSVILDISSPLIFCQSRNNSLLVQTNDKCKY